MKIPRVNRPLAAAVLWLAATGAALALALTGCSGGSSVTAPPPPPPAPVIAGQWVSTNLTGSSALQLYLVTRPDGTVIGSGALTAGTVFIQIAPAGHYSGGSLSIDLMPYATPGLVTFTGSVAGDTMTGTLSFTTPPAQSFAVTLRRQ